MKLYCPCEFFACKVKKILEVKILRLQSLALYSNCFKLVKNYYTEQTLEFENLCFLNFFTCTFQGMELE